MQDFERAFHAELLLEADLESKQRADFRKLPKWIRQYAYRAWQDRIYFDRNVTWFQQEVILDYMFCHISSVTLRNQVQGNVTWFQQEVIFDQMFCHLSASLVPFYTHIYVCVHICIYILFFSNKHLTKKAYIYVLQNTYSHDRPIVQGYPDGCQHRFTSPAEAKALPHEGALALVDHWCHAQSQLQGNGCQKH